MPWTTGQTENVNIVGIVEEDWVYAKRNEDEYRWHSIIYGPGLEDRFDEYFDSFSGGGERWKRKRRSRIFAFF